MDAKKFDTITKAMQTASSRRQTLTTLLAGALGLVGLAEVAAKKDKKSDKKCPPCRKKKNGHCNKGRKPDGTPCGPDKICLSGKCRQAPTV